MFEGSHVHFELLLCVSSLFFYSAWHAVARIFFILQHPFPGMSLSGCLAGFCLVNRGKISRDVTHTNWKRFAGLLNDIELLETLRISASSLQKKERERERGSGKKKKEKKETYISARYLDDGVIRCTRFRTKPIAQMAIRL